MKHLFHEGSNPNAPTLLLLHGTGGDENDLLPLASAISPHSSVLSVKGNVCENGMARYFRRLAEGVFDEEDLIFRTKELHDFLNERAQKYKFERKKIVAIGYSNGANIAASLLFHFQHTLRGAVLFHPMVPIRGKQLPSLKEVPVFIGAGKRDPLIPVRESEELVQILMRANCNVTEFWGDGGHQLTGEEVEQAKQWFQKQFL